MLLLASVRASCSARFRSPETAICEYKSKTLTADRKARLLLAMAYSLTPTVLPARVMGGVAPLAVTGRPLVEDVTPVATDAAEDMALLLELLRMPHCSGVLPFRSDTYTACGYAVISSSMTCR